jgi:hypothetical protein
MINRKKLVLAFIIISSLFLLFLFLNATNNNNKDVVNIQVAPKDAKIILDNKTTTRTGEQALTSGKHTIRTSRDGFSDNQQTFFTKKGEISTVLVGLTPNSPIGTKYIEDNQDEFVELQNLGSLEYNKGAEALAKKYPMIIDLPIDAYYYQIDYGKSSKYPDDPNSIAIYIRANTPFYRQTAVYSIYNLGYDPSDYEIIFEPLSI